MSSMTVGAAILLLWILVMLALHLGSRRLVERVWEPEGERPAWLTLAALARFEGLYYVAALIYGESVVLVYITWHLVEILALGEAPH